MNAFPTRGGGCFGYDEAPVRGMQCVQSVGAGLPDRPAVGSYRYNQAQANPSPGPRTVEDAAPTRGVGCFGNAEAPVRGTQCVQSVGDSLPGLPGGMYPT